MTDPAAAVAQPPPPATTESTTVKPEVTGPAAANSNGQQPVATKPELKAEAAPSSAPASSSSAPQLNGVHTSAESPAANPPPVKSDAAATQPSPAASPATTPPVASAATQPRANIKLQTPSNIKLQPNVKLQRSPSSASSNSSGAQRLASASPPPPLTSPQQSAATAAQQYQQSQFHHQQQHNAAHTMHPHHTANTGKASELQQHHPGSTPSSSPLLPPVPMHMLSPSGIPHMQHPHHLQQMMAAHSPMHHQNHMMQMTPQQMLAMQQAAAASVMSVPTPRQQQQQPPAAAAASDDDNDDDSVTRCICGDQRDNNGLMIACEQCGVWQHAVCIGLSEDAVPDMYYCEQCHPNEPYHTQRRQRIESGEMADPKLVRSQQQPKGKKRNSMQPAPPAKAVPEKVQVPGRSEKKSKKTARRKRQETDASVNEEVASTNVGSPQDNKRRRTSASDAAAADVSDMPANAATSPQGHYAMPDYAADVASPDLASSREARKMQKLMEQIKRMEEQERTSKHGPAQPEHRRRQTEDHTPGSPNASKLQRGDSELSQQQQAFPSRQASDAAPASDTRSYGSGEIDAFDADAEAEAAAAQQTVDTAMSRGSRAARRNANNPLSSMPPVISPTANEATVSALPTPSKPSGRGRGRPASKKQQQQATQQDEDDGSDSEVSGDNPLPANGHSTAIRYGPLGAQSLNNGVSLVNTLLHKALPAAPMYLGKKQWLMSSWSNEVARHATGWTLDIHQPLPITKRLLLNYMAQQKSMQSRQPAQVCPVHAQHLHPTVTDQAEVASANGSTIDMTAADSSPTHVDSTNAVVTDSAALSPQLAQSADDGSDLAAQVVDDYVLVDTADAPLELVNAKLTSAAATQIPAVQPLGTEPSAADSSVAVGETVPMPTQDALAVADSATTSTAAVTSAMVPDQLTAQNDAMLTTNDTVMSSADDKVEPSSELSDVNVLQPVDSLSTATDVQPAAPQQPPAAAPDNVDIASNASLDSTNATLQPTEQPAQQTLAASPTVTQSSEADSVTPPAMPADTVDVATDSELLISAASADATNVRANSTPDVAPSADTAAPAETTDMSTDSTTTSDQSLATTVTAPAASPSTDVTA